MTLEHEFFLIKKNIDMKYIWKLNKNELDFIDMVTIHDDFIVYINDSLKWIPSINPINPNFPRQFGINYYELTLFDKKSALIFKNILTSWENLIRNAPDKIYLTGQYEWNENNKDEGEYKELQFNKQDLIIQLEKIITFTQKLETGEYYILHRGI
ncbi:hypothetical protein [Bacillus sp. S10(2024)]|uniref:hypothetical protein n=1 Tax=Bacillus sp. S10(2024) TaxID=3162886 RepID=UPI003D1AA1F4